MDEVAIEVACALPAQQVVLKLRVPAGTRLKEAVLRSGILERFPRIDAGHLKLGVFGRVASLAEAVQPGDRIEIYRDLTADPKAARRQRAARGKKIKVASPGAGVAESE